jgi:citrate synthase
MSSQASNFSLGDKQVQMPVKEGTIGPSVVDISKLYGQTGMFTYDPGFTSTAACESSITYIDGDEGVLLYRGYPIEQLAEHGDFLEPATCCFTASCRPPRRRPISTTASRATPWCTTR